VRRALRGLGSERKEIKYIGLLMFCLLGQNKFEVSNQEGEDRRKIKIQ
jgi:hypothetical protein